MALENRPFIIPIFIPNAGCPHQCVFCNQTAITRVQQKIPSREQLCSQISQFLQYKGKDRKAVQIAFYGGNFLGLKRDDVVLLLTEASKFVQTKQVDNIRFSTRPDTITHEQLDMIKDFTVSTIEIGVQSMDDEVLTLAKRGHTASDTKKAAFLLKKQGYEIGLQMMTGLPGDDERKAIDTARKIITLSPDFVRIYPTVVLEKSLLGKWYRNGKYTPPSLASSVTLVKQLYQLFKEKNIPVIRMGLQATEDFDKETTILAGPYHPAFGHLVHSEIFLDMAIRNLKFEIGNLKFGNSNSQNFSLLTSHFSLLISVHPKSISKMRGLKNKNIDILKKRFPIKDIKVIPDISLSEESLKIEIS